MDVTELNLELNLEDEIITDSDYYPLPDYHLSRFDYDLKLFNESLNND